MIDPCPAKQYMNHPAAIHLSRKGVVPSRIVFIWPLAFEKCLRLAVAPLLFPVSSDRVAAMMQHHRAWGKTERPTPLLQAPTKIDVVASDSEYGIEPAHGFKA